MLLIKNSSRADIAMPVCLSFRMNAVISETIKARTFGNKHTASCHARSNAFKPPKTKAPTVLMLEKNFTWNQTAQNRSYERSRLENYDTV